MKDSLLQTLLQTVIEATDDPVVVKDLEGRCLLANRAAAWILGRPAEDLIGNTAAELFPAQVAEQIQVADRQVLESGRPLTVDEHLPAGGTFHIYSTRRIPVRDEGGQIVGLVAVGHDITERTQTEEALRVRTRALDERVKELNCLFGISALVEEPGISLDRLLQGAVALIPPAWQYPNITAARIILVGQEYRTRGFAGDSAWRQTAEIIVHGRQSGIVEVCYREERPESDEGPFLREERDLLNAIAQRLGRITERLRAEEALQASQVRLQALAASTPTYIYEVDADGTIQFVNRTYEGLTQEQVAGTNLIDWFPGPQRARIASLIERAFSTGEPQSTEYTIPDPQGEMRSYAAEITLLPVRGRAQTVVLTATDITERKRAEEALQDAHNALERRVERRTVQLSELNALLQQEINERRRAEQQLRRANRGLETLSECNAVLSRAEEESELLGDICRVAVEIGGYRLAWVGFAEQDEAKTVRPVAQAGFEEGYLETLHITWDDTERGRGPTGTAIRTGQPAIARNILTDPHFAPWREEAKRRGYASSVALPLQTPGQVLGSLNIYAGEPEAFDAEEVRLLTKLADNLAYGLVAQRTEARRREAEETLRALNRELSELEMLREMDRLRSELVGNVSHELRTPLGLIKVFASTLSREDVLFDRETQQEFLHNIEDEADKLEHIVDSLLDLSRMEARALRLHMRPADLVALATEVEETMAAQYPSHLFRHDFPPEPLVAMVDAGRIEQVLRNLLDNAAKYSPPRTTITVRGCSAEGWISLQVCDQGIGIPPDDLGRVFERFYRVPNEVTKRARGAGLGLAVCQGIVEAHGGRIWTESAPGEGSTFSVALPAGSAAQDH